MKKLITTSLIALATCVSLRAATVSISPTPADLDDLDHHSVYTWNIQNINLTGVSITSASLTIKNIANWDTNPNVLYIHLLDSAIFSGVHSFIDDPSGSAPVTDLTDDFANSRFHNSPGWLVAHGVRDLFLASPSFTMVGHDFVINFNAAQLDALNSYIANGKDVAFGFDPDCHFFNDGITFKYTTSPIPEFNSALPVAGLAALAVMLELRRRRAARSVA